MLSVINLDSLVEEIFMFPRKRMSINQGRNGKNQNSKTKMTEGRDRQRNGRSKELWKVRWKGWKERRNQRQSQSYFVLNVKYESSKHQCAVI